MLDKEKNAYHKETKNSRREFLKLAGVTVAVATVAKLGLGGLDKVQAAGVTTTTPLPAPLPLALAAGATDVLIRLQQELALALKKPRNERHWHMVIDLRKCVGCSACTIACISENKLPPGVVYRPVMDEEIGTYPNVTRRFTPRPCMQCDNPPCTQVCPVNATWKQEDGVVVVDYNRCIGCRYCITACPYSARTADFGATYNKDNPEAKGIIVGQVKADDYERIANFEYGKKWARTKNEDSPVGNARKCQFCLHRVENGMLPACVTTCIGRATYFGDANNPDSLVSELVSKLNVMRLREELGTEPSTYYLL
jgi:molybdopterin-containing oxidoreductase family iron-sulfur binding subunit